jgi:hypothetical protein
MRKDTSSSSCSDSAPVMKPARMPDTWPVNDAAGTMRETRTREAKGAKRAGKRRPSTLTLAEAAETDWKLVIPKRTQE